MQEVNTLDNLHTSPAKSTGTTDKEIVVCIGGKRILLTSDDEVYQSIEQIIPRKVQIKFSEDGFFLLKNYRTSFYIYMCISLDVLHLIYDVIKVVIN